MDHPPTFSESWHRIADARVALRPQVRVHRQAFRGEKWFVLRNPYSNAFFRLRPEAWAFVARLSTDRTVDAVWRQCLELDPEGAPGQAEVLQLLAQLHAADLLLGSEPAEAARVAERREKRVRRERTWWLLNLMFARFPLYNPDRLLLRLLPYTRWIYTRWTFLAWLALLAVAGKAVIDTSGRLADQTQGVLAPENLPLLYLCLAGLGVIHELGHALTCRRFGGPVHTVGILLMVFTPLPYVDVSSAWSFREKRQRLLVGVGGMMFELTIAAAAALVWANTGAGLVNTLAFNVMFLASVSTLLFNANPLLRFDGYYLLSDALGIANLYSRGQQQLRYLAEKYLLRLRSPRPPARSRSEARLLGWFGLLSALYRVFIFATILLFVANHYLLLGLIMAAVAIAAWLVVPAGKLVHYLATSQQLDRNRSSAIARTALALAVPAAALAFIPLPASFTAPGVVQSAGYRLVVVESPGELRDLPTPTGSAVEPGMPVARLENPFLDAEWRGALARVAEAEARLRQTLEGPGTNRRAVEQFLAVAQQQRDRLAAQRAALTVAAGAAGIWVAPALADHVGRWLPRGTVLGEVIDPTRFEVAGVVAQNDASRLFSSGIRRVRARVNGHPWATLEVAQFRVLPGQRERLPTATLGWAAGGPVAVRPDDPAGVATREPFFEVRATLQEPRGVELRHGRTALLHFALPPEPALRQAWRRLQQLLQERYQL